MLVVFGLVIIGLIVSVLIMMNSDKKQKIAKKGCPIGHPLINKK
jgi:hypothetical protein